MERATDIVFMLDASGSMYPLTEDTIGGFNSFLASQRALGGRAYLKVILFNDRSHTIINNDEIHSVNELTTKDYKTGGMTALLDAIGKAIQATENEPNVGSKHIFVITTDGMENSSKEYSYKTIRDLIEEKTKKGWEFIFLGANINSFEVGKSLGIKIETISNYTASPVGTQIMFNSVSKAVNNYRENGTVNKSWKAEL